MEAKNHVKKLYNAGRLVEAYESFQEMGSIQHTVPSDFAAQLRAEYRQYDTLKTEIKNINSMEYTDYTSHDEVSEIYRDFQIRHKKTIENTFMAFTVKSDTPWPTLASVLFSVTGIASLVPDAKILVRVVERKDNYLIAIFTFPGKLLNGHTSKSYKIVCKMQIISDRRPLDADNRPTTPYVGFLLTDQCSNTEYADEFNKCEGTPVTNFSVLVTARKDVCPSLISCCIQHRKTCKGTIMHSFVDSIMAALIRRQLWFLIDIWLRKGILLYHVSKCTSGLRSLIREQFDDAFVKSWFSS